MLFSFKQQSQTLGWLMGFLSVWSWTLTFSRNEKCFAFCTKAFTDTRSPKYQIKSIGIFIPIVGCVVSCSKMSGRLLYVSRMWNYRWYFELISGKKCLHWYFSILLKQLETFLTWKLFFEDDLFFDLFRCKNK